MCSISIHAPAKGATRTTTPPCLLIISIHAPAKGATSTSTTVYCSFSFQSTLPRRERRVERWRYLLLAAYFNPRSREGSDVDQLIYVDQILSISIHAPAKGATACIWRLTGGRLYFNPRSREGSDALRRYQRGLHNPISIHAPAKGATVKPGRYLITFSDFNPRSREGSDGVCDHRPCAVRDFNPRSREGSDGHRSKPGIQAGKISIHAPAKGATFSCSGCNSNPIISIHAPAKGAT